MRTSASHLLAAPLALLLLLSGCMAPMTTPEGIVTTGYGANAGYFALDPAQAEANRQNTNRVEQEARDMNHQERMRQAQATELATRHAPTHVSTTNVWFPWW